MIEEMAIYRSIHVSFWTDPKVDDSFTPEDKYFYLYLLTNPHTNICGCYEIGDRQLQRETGYSKETIARLLQRMEKVHNVIRYEPDTKEILLLNWHRYNWTSSEKLIKAVMENCSYVKSPRFQTYIRQLLSGNNAEFPDRSDTLSIPYSHHTHTSVSVAVSDIVSDSEDNIVPYPETKSLFLAWAQDHGITDEFADLFFDRYTANGWVDQTGSQIRNWQTFLLSAWQKGKKNLPLSPADTLTTIRERRKQDAHYSYTPDDCVEWPPASGKYIGRDELEAMQVG